MHGRRAGDGDSLATVASVFSASRHPPQHLYNLHNGTRKLLAAQIQIQQLQILATLTHGPEQHMSFGAQKRNCKVFAAEISMERRGKGVSALQGRGRWLLAGRSRTKAQSELALHANRVASHITLVNMELLSYYKYLNQYSDAPNKILVLHIK